jgi:ABC-2 type transport system ATP-binding protein
VGATSDPLVVMKAVGRTFGTRAVLTGVELSIAPKQLVGVVGPNGGGKSTLLMLIAGLLRPTTGTISVCGVDAATLALTTASRVGLVTARPGLYPLLTARENLHHFGGLFELTPAQVDAKAEPLARTLELAALDERIGRLSTGMQQKVSLLRALLLSPQVLLLDEPTANLDPPSARAFFGEVRKRVDDGLACVLATHDLPGAEAVCDRVLLIDGRIKKELSFDGPRAPLQGPLLAAWQKALGTR